MRGGIAQPIFGLHPSADPEDQDQEGTETPSGEEEAPTATSEWEAALTGLHAKLYVMDDGWDARIWTGSANATEAAFERNVEFLVELVGKKSFCGIDAMLGNAESKEASMASLLVPFVAEDHPLVDTEEEAARLALDRAATALSRLQLRALASSSEAELFAVELRAEGPWPVLPDGLRILCRPVTLPSAAGVSVEPGEQVLGRFGPVTVEALTQFFALELSLRAGKQEKSTRFVVNVPLEGAPADRRERVLRALLRDPEQVLRLIWLLLAAEDLRVEDWVAAAASGNGKAKWRSAGAGGTPILEVMLKALSREPGKLDELAKLVADLRRTAEGTALLPPGFDAIWEPIWTARQELS